METVKLLKEGDLGEKEDPVQRQRKASPTSKRLYPSLRFLDDVCSHGNKKLRTSAGLVVVLFNKKKKTRNSSKKKLISKMVLFHLMIFNLDIILSI